MADSAKIRSGLAGLMQDHLSDKAVSLLVNTMPLIYFLINRDGNKATNLKGTGNGAPGFYGLGRFATGSLFSGVPVSKTRREQILNSDKYMPIVNTILPPASDGKVATMTDTMPTRANATTNTTSSRFVRPFFKWVERIDPILVWKKEIRRTKKAAANEKAASVAVGDLFKSEAEQVMTTHLQWWNEQFWGTNGAAGAPSNVDADVWDANYSLRNANKADNVYGGVDRSIAGNAWWRGNYDNVARPPVFEDLINDACFVKGIAKKGQGAELALCSVLDFPVFWAEVKAKGGQIYYDGLPDMGEVGFKRPVFRFNNTFCTFDPECPQGDLAVLNLSTWTVAVSPDANFTVDDAFDLSKTDGGKDAIKSQIRTEMIVANEAPGLNVYYDNIQQG
jgi:hypothetical protein